MRVPRRLPEVLAGVLLLMMGVGTRLAVVATFPTIPVADFHNLVAFGLHFRDQGIFSKGYLWFWDFFNPGFPLVLCGLFHLTPGVNPDSVARLSTAVACGLMPLLPFLIWRGVLPFGVRVAASAALALWPGQVLFSGTAAQDNWVMFPAVALGALAVRALHSSEPPRLMTAALLYAAGVAIRQEMVVMLLPLFLDAAGVKRRSAWRRWVMVGLAAVLPLAALATYRYACTGRFALTTRHGGLTILGSYIPGAAGGWIQPSPYIASVEPELLTAQHVFHADVFRSGFGR